MKRLINFICLGVLIGTFGVACDKSGLYGEGVYRGKLHSNCWVFVKTTPGEETILLAQTGLTDEESDAKREEFKSEYGEDNIRSWGLTPPIPIDVSLDGLDCYEYTMTYEFIESYMPTAEQTEQIENKFITYRMNSRTIICKAYFWAFTEEDAAEFASELEGDLTIIDWSYGYITLKTIAKQKGSVAYKNLGPFVENMPITL